MNMKGAAVYDVAEKKVLVSRHVTFHESIFPYSSSKPVTQAQCWEPTNHIPTTTNTSFPFHDSHDTDLNQPTNPNTNSHTNSEPEPENQNQATTTNTNINHNLPLPRRSQRHPKPPSHLTDFVCNSTSSTTCSYPIHNYISYTNLSYGYRAYALSLCPVPGHYSRTF